MDSNSLGFKFLLGEHYNVHNPTISRGIFHLFFFCSLLSLSLEIAEVYNSDAPFSDAISVWAV